MTNGTRGICGLPLNLARVNLLREAKVLKEVNLAKEAKAAKGVNPKAVKGVKVPNQ
jgi:hypothetical protein